MATAEKLLTAEEFAQLRDLDGPAELVRGRIVMMNVPYSRHGHYCFQLARHLWQYVERHDLGRVLTNDSGIITARHPDSVRGADVAYYSFNRLPRGPLPNGYFPIAPELACEVRSHEQRWKELVAKSGEYLAAGVLTVAILDPDTQSVHLYHENRPTEVLGPDDDLTFPQILGDFRVKVAELFV